MELEPCPFCQSNSVELWIETDGNLAITDAWVECDYCHAKGPSDDTEAGAIMKWNAANKS